jgi:hypothetical protein
VQDTLNRHKFGGYQGTYENAPLASQTFQVPTAASLAGDFTALEGPACNGGKQITLKAPFANNKIAATSLNPVAVSSRD